MTQNELLREQYEDALIALFMHEFSVQEGKQCLDMLSEEGSSNEFGVSEETDKRILKEIDSCLAKYKRIQRKSITKRGLRVLSAMIVVASLLFSVTWAFSEDVRVSTVNLYFDIRERYTQIMMKEEGEIVYPNPEETMAENSFFDEYIIGWIPDGFECIIGKPDLYVRFADKNDEYIMITKVDSASVNIDTENAESIENITVNGKDGVCVTKDGETHVIVVEKDHREFIDVITSKGIPAETAFKILENIYRKSEDCDTEEQSYLNHVRIGWIPDGFELYSYQKNFEMIYYNAENEWLRINQFPTGIYGTYSVDTENAEFVEEITINGLPGIAIIKEGQPHIALWYINAVSPNDSIIIDLDGSTGVTMETIKKVAENLTVIPAGSDK